MQVHVTLYGAARVVAGRNSIDLSFDEPSVTLAQLLTTLVARHPRVRPYLLQDNLGDGESLALLTNIRVLLNGTRPEHDVTLATPLHDNDHIAFLILVAGGRPLQ